MRLGLTDDGLRNAAALLPTDKRERMKCYRRRQDREAFLVGRLAVLYLLRERGYVGDCLGALTYGAYGKPAVAGYELNLSHSGDYVLCAVSEQGPVGVDLERQRQLDPAELRSFLSAAQWATICVAADQQRQLFDLWTRLESVLKGDGGGLSIAAADVELDGDWARVGGTEWHLRSLAIDHEYAAHLATQHARTAIVLRRLPAEQMLAELLASSVLAQT